MNERHFCCLWSKKASFAAPLRPPLLNQEILLHRYSVIFTPSSDHASLSNAPCMNFVDLSVKEVLLNN